MIVTYINAKGKTITRSFVTIEEFNFFISYLDKQIECGKCGGYIASN